MDYLLDLLQGLGLAAAIGIRPYLPALLAGALASANVGLDFDGTSFSFLEAPWFLLVLLVLLAAVAVLERREGSRSAALMLLLASALALGALYAAGSLDDNFTTWWPGVPVGVAAASLGFVAARSLFDRVRARLDTEAAGALPLYGEAAALPGPGLSILFPPLAILLVAALVWLLIGGRRRAGEKYA